MVMAGVAKRFGVPMGICVCRIACACMYRLPVCSLLLYTYTFTHARMHTHILTHTHTHTHAVRWRRLAQFRGGANWAVTTEVPVFSIQSFPHWMFHPDNHDENTNCFDWRASLWFTSSLCLWRLVLFTVPNTVRLCARPQSRFCGYVQFSTLSDFDHASPATGTLLLSFPSETDSRHFSSLGWVWVCHIVSYVWTGVDHLMCTLFIKLITIFCLDAHYVCSIMFFLI